MWGMKHTVNKDSKKVNACTGFFVQFLRQVLDLAIIAALVSLSGCTTSSAPSSLLEPISPDNLALIQQNGNVSARLYGIMDFDYSGGVVRIPSELLVSGVPLTWMGAIFNGKYQKTGSGQTVTEEVHGSISADGDWVETVFFSRQITRINNSSTFYRVTLRNLHLKYATDTASTTTVIFESSGTDIQKYIAKIEYADGLLKDNRIESSISYISTDWQNNSPGQTPALSLTFGKGSGNGGQLGKPAM
jgi:hypothetical protein